MKLPYIKEITWFLIIMMSILSIVPRVEAGFVSSEIIALTHTERNADLEKIQKILELKAISERLKQLGFTKEEIQMKLEQLSDQQIHQLALKLDELKVGQDDFLGVIIALLVIAILVVVLLNLTGHKVIITR